MDSKSYIQNVQRLLDKLSHEQIEKTCRALIRLRQKGGTLYIIGNGGSASLGSHLACDLNKAVTSRPLMKVNCLSDHIAEITAIANDSCYDNIFSDQLENLMQPDDMVFAISTSGNSVNVVKGLKYAREIGVESIGLLGFDGGEAKQWVTYPIIIPDNSVQRLEDIHLIVSHIIFLKMLEPVKNFPDP